MNSSTAFETAIVACPVISILRGIRSDEAIEIVEALYGAGIRIAEVPLNSPDPFATIGLLRAHFGDRMIIGAGTVTAADMVEHLACAGGQISVSPNCDYSVIAACLKHDIVPMPGFATATEAFQAIAAGAKFLKLFPAGNGASEFVRSLKAVLPADIAIFAVGGVNSENIAELATAGCAGFGIGSDIFKPGFSADEVATRATRLVLAARSAKHAPNCRALTNPEAVIGESPIIADGALLWVDPVERTLFNYRFADGDIDQLKLDQAISAIGFVHGKLVGIAGSGFYEIDRANGDCGSFAQVQDMGDGCRLNDWAIDSVGGLWAGSMHNGLLGGKGKIVRTDLSGDVQIVFEGLGVSNGMAFDHAETTLYVVDTVSRNLLAFPADISAATLGEPRIVSDFLGLAGKPDGLAVAPDGKIWVAMWGGASVVEIAIDGSTRRIVPVAAPHVSSLCFDPDDPGICYITTSRMRLSPMQIKQNPLSGAMFALDTKEGSV